jgi:hypothetical protein
MIEPPDDLLAAVPTGTADIVREWWSSLADDERQRLADLWDERLEVCFFTPQADAAGNVDDWSQIPKVVGGRFVPTDDTSGLSEWGPGYFEHLLSHPELVIVCDPLRRTFHIGGTAAARPSI